MKLENISLYNFTNAINNLITFKDSNAGYADYNTVREISNAKGRSVVDTIFLQNDNKMCEYCVIGNNDLKDLLSLRDYHAYWQTMNSIVVQMTVTASPEWIEQFKEVAGDLFPIDKYKDNLYVFVMTYYDIRYINQRVKYQSDEWDYFLSRINSLPYVQQLIL